MYMVVDVKTTEADVIACLYFFLLADVVANIFVADVITTCYSMRRCLLMAGIIAIYICGRCCNHWGWCYCLLCFILLADVITNILWQML